EEDAGKSIHDQHDSFSLVDINRAGVPLLEIVTEPDFRSGQEVSDFMAELQRVVQYLQISDANMEEGAFRCDCNVSVKKIGVEVLGERCEIKNMNSRRYAKNAIEYEAKRQIDVLESGGDIQKTTMLYDPIENVTRPMRKKESENDYRYFPEPDLPPVSLSQSYIDETKASLTMLPIDRYLLFSEQYHLSAADADFLCENKLWSDTTLALIGKTDQPKELIELMLNKIIPHIKAENIEINELGESSHILSFIQMISNEKVAKSAAYQHVFPLWVVDISQSPEVIASSLGMIKSDDQSFLDEIISTIISENEDKVSAYQSGKTGLLGFFMGQVKQKAGGSADPVIMKEKLEARLKK
ncbi:MAG: Asp-tRNA(Asn)/Glu-tRNA(Gln) amidotransferase subunit GatB, partial [Saprospiraceae bacterium]